MGEDDTWYMASLVVSSRTLSAEHIARVLETAGSEQVEQGSPAVVCGRVLSLHKESVWSLNSRLGCSDTAEAQIEELLDFAEAKADVLASLAKDCDVRMLVSFWTPTGQGGLSLEPRTLRRFGELHITLDVSSLLCEDDDDA